MGKDMVRQNGRVNQTVACTTIWLATEHGQELNPSISVFARQIFPGSLGAWTKALRRSS